MSTPLETNDSQQNFDIAPKKSAAISRREEAMYKALLTKAKRRAMEKNEKNVCGQPLIDIVNPQPKAFFAYLNMPPKKEKAARAARGRVSRRSVKKG